MQAKIHVYVIKTKKFRVIEKLNSNLQIDIDWRQYETIEIAINSETDKIINPKGCNKIIRAVTKGGHPYLILLGTDKDRYGCGAFVDYFSTTIKMIRTANNKVEII